MLNPKILRRDIEAVTIAMRRRGMDFPVEHYLNLDTRRKETQIKTETLQNEMKNVSKQIGRTEEHCEKREELVRQGEQLKQDIKDAHEAFRQVNNELNDFLAGLPNIPDERVPEGADENENIEVERYGVPPEFDFEPRDHMAIGEALGMIDGESASRVAGSRFTVLYGDLARLQRSLTQWMLDVQTREHGYREAYVPYIVKPDSLFGTGQLPKFADDVFAISGRDAFLIPTAEVPLTNLYRDTILEEEQLPVKLVAHTPCFRSEAGAYGKDTHGLIRQHQFEKVELVQVVRPSDSRDTLEALTGHAEAILKALGLPYRKVILCGGDLGFSAAMTYDLEVWLPGQQRYREISSCSNMTDFQARRMKLRIRDKQSGKIEPAHTLNGSGLAVGRALLAIIEIYQTADGCIRIPEVLRPYMNGQDIIRPE